MQKFLGMCLSHANRQRMWRGEMDAENQGGKFGSLSLPPENEYCCICHGNFTIPCQANCAHWFCGACIMLVWQHTAAFRPCKCPICRSPIKRLTFSEPVTSDIDDAERDRVIREISNYDRIHGGRLASFLQRIWDIPFSLYWPTRSVMDPHRALSLVLKVYIFLYLTIIVLYFMSPFNFLPEGIFGILGFVEEIIIVVIMFFLLASLYQDTLIQDY